MNEKFSVSLQKFVRMFRKVMTQSMSDIAPSVGGRKAHSYTSFSKLLLNVDS